MRAKIRPLVVGLMLAALGGAGALAWQLGTGMTAGVELTALLTLVAGLAGWTGATLLRMARPWQNPFGRSFWRVAWTTGVRAWRHEAGDTAAGMAYFALLALVPYLIVLLSFVTWLVPADLVQVEANALLEDALPPSAYTVAARQIHDILHGHRVGLVSVAALLMVWSASELLDSTLGGVARAQGVPFRGVGRRFVGRLAALGATVAIGVVVAVALGLGIGGTYLVNYALDHTPLQTSPALSAFLLEALRWGLAFVTMALVVALAYRAVPFPPDRLRPPIPPGTSFVVASWLGLNVGFRWYVAAFGDYDAVYGVLGGVVVLLVWLYLYGLAFLAGAELNVVVAELAVDER